MELYHLSYMSSRILIPPYSVRCVCVCHRHLACRMRAVGPYVSSLRYHLTPPQTFSPLLFSSVSSLCSFHHKTLLSALTSAHHLIYSLFPSLSFPPCFFHLLPILVCTSPVPPSSPSSYLMVQALRAEWTHHFMGSTLLACLSRSSRCSRRFIRPCGF